MNLSTGINLQKELNAIMRRVKKPKIHDKEECIFCCDDNYDDVAWCVENSNGTTHPVALKKPNCFGLYDMSGNVYEWCLDYFDMYKMDNYYCKTQVNPVCTSSKQERLSRIVRGGSYYSCSNRSRVSYRTSYTWGTTYSFIGLRRASSSLKK